MLIVAIVVVEVAFWVVLLAGLATRYLLRWPRVSLALLAGVHVVNLALLVVTVLDLRSGATADATHGLVAFYIGVTLVFGHSLVRWADQRFAHRFAGGPPPVKAPKRGPARARYEWVGFGKAVFAAAITAALLGAGILYVGDADRTAALLGWFPKMGGILAIWFVVGPLYYTLRQGRTESPAP